MYVKPEMQVIDVNELDEDIIIAACSGLYCKSGFKTECQEGFSV